jgi:ankyrin repeat protein
MIASCYFSHLLVYSRNIFSFYSSIFVQDGWTALMGAAMKDHLDIVTLLLDRGAKIETTNNVSHNEFISIKL